MKMIRIAKMPFIIEDTDRWGVGLGTFSVVDVQGEMPEEMWSRVKEFEGYHLSTEGQAETEAFKEASKAAALAGIDSVTHTMPYMKKVIGYCNSQLWEFNLRVCEVGDDTYYIRSYAKFAQITLHEWTPEHDEKVNQLKEQAKQMNVKV